jgi:uncharacterized membrane protein (UPF0127 family)
MGHPRRAVVLNQSKGTSLGNRIEIADSSVTRFVGLLGRRGMVSGGGLLIVPSYGVHTLGMLFPIDVVFVDKEHRVVGLRKFLRPFRLTSLNWKAESVLELPVNTIDVTRTEIGDRLSIEID